jgi:chromosome segregation ATPase
MTQREEVVFNWNWEKPEPPQPDPVKLQSERELYLEVVKQHEQLVKNEFRFEANENKLEQVKNCAVHLLGWSNQLGNSIQETQNAILADREKFSKFVALVEKIELDGQQAGSSMSNLAGSVSEIWTTLKKWSEDFSAMNEHVENLKEEFGRLGQAVVDARHEDLAKINRAENEIESLRFALSEATHKIAQIQDQIGGQQIPEEKFARLEQKQRMLEEGFHHLERVGAQWDQFVVDEMKKMAGGHLSLHAALENFDRRQKLFETMVLGGELSDHSHPRAGGGG